MGQIGGRDRRLTDQVFRVVVSPVIPREVEMVFPDASRRQFLDLENRLEDVRAALANRLADHPV